ncbi:hypothetical protein ACTHTW_10800, partial [Neisseria sp. P0018.S006]
VFGLLGVSGWLCFLVGWFLVLVGVVWWFLWRGCLASSWVCVLLGIPCLCLFVGLGGLGCGFWVGEFWWWCVGVGCWCWGGGGLWGWCLFVFVVLLCCCCGWLGCVWFCVVGRLCVGFELARLCGFGCPWSGLRFWFSLV